jgi:hypothetical protein
VEIRKRQPKFPPTNMSVCLGVCLCQTGKKATIEGEREREREKERERERERERQRERGFCSSRRPLSLTEFNLPAEMKEEEKKGSRK